MAPGRSGGFLLPSPLRTVRDSFPSYGSSTNKAHSVKVNPVANYFCNLSDNSLQPTHLLRRGAHDKFSFSFICFPQFIGSVKFLTIKHQTKVSAAFACGNVATAIHLITRWPSLYLSSLSGVSRCLTVTVLSRLFTRNRWEKAPGFHVPHKWQMRGVRLILSADWSTSPYKLR